MVLVERAGSQVIGLKERKVSKRYERVNSSSHVISTFHKVTRFKDEFVPGDPNKEGQLGFRTHVRDYRLYVITDGQRVCCQQKKNPRDGAMPGK